MNTYGRIIWSDDGFVFESKKRIYNLCEGFTIGGMPDQTTDKVIILDDYDIERPAQIVGFVYGAFMLFNPSGRADLEKAISDIVYGYEQAETLD